MHSSDVVAAVSLRNNAFHLRSADLLPLHLQLFFVETSLHEFVEQELSLDALELGN